MEPSIIEDLDQYINDNLVVTSYCRTNLCLMDEIDDYLSENYVDCKFSEVLLRIIDKHHLDDIEAYKRSAVDRKLFSKIKQDRNYHPSKRLVAQFVIGMRLSEKEAKILMKSAGYTLTHSDLFDCIILFFIKNNIYDINYVDEALYRYGLKPLFSKE